MKNKITQIFIGILISLTVVEPISAYFEYKYQDGKLYYFDNERYENTGAGYLFWIGILSMNNPAILGVIGVLGGFGYAVEERDVAGGILIAGFGVTELYLDTLPDKTISYWLNGGLAGLTLFSGLFKGEETYPPKKMEISPQIMLREDIKLQYTEAKKIYFELVDKGYVESGLNKGRLSKKFNPNEKIYLSEQFSKFSDYVNWVLTQVSFFNQNGINPNIVFSAPPKENK